MGTPWDVPVPRKTTSIIALHSRTPNPWRKALTGSTRRFITICPLDPMPLPPSQLLYQFLRGPVCTSPEPADTVIGFGHFDLRIARHCGDLFRQGRAKRIIFTGGLGAGSADLSQPEAKAFAAELARTHPEIPTTQILLESTSTNTGENVQNTLQAAAERNWPLDRVILVATPFRQRRVMQTWRQRAPRSQGQSSPPSSSLDIDIALFATKNEVLLHQLPGELDRLTLYASRGWIAPVPIPDDVHQAAITLRSDCP